MVTNVFAVDLWLCFPGYYDVGLNRGFEISFEVLPDRINHNGPLFSMGTDEFQYYEWKTKAVKTQFLVIEFVYSAVRFND